MIKALLRLYDWFEKHSWCLWLSLAASVAVMSVFALRIDYQEDITSFFPKEGEDGSSSEAFENLKVKDKMVFMISGSDDPYALVDAGYALADGLQAVIDEGLLNDVTEGVDASTISRSADFIYNNLPIYLTDADYARMDSLCSRQAVKAGVENCYRMISSPAGMMVGDVMMKDPLGFGTPLMQGFQNFDTGTGYELFSDHIFSSDMSTMLMFANPSSSMGSTGVNDRLTTMVEDICDSVSEENGVKVEYFCAGSVAAYNARIIKRDTILTISIALLVIILVISLAFRSRAAIPLILIPVVYGSLFALFLIFFIQGSISAIAIGAGAAVLGVALSYSIHVIAHSNHTPDPRKIIEELAYPLTVGSITTIGAFAALIFTHSSLLHDFGLFTSLTLIGTTVFCLVYLPHFIKGSNSVTKSRTLRFIEKCVDYPLDHNKWVVGGLSLLFLVCCFFCGKVSFDDDMNHLNYMPKHLQAAEDRLLSISGDDSDQTFLVTVAPNMDEACAKYDRMVSVTDSLASCGAIDSYVSAREYIIPTAVQEERIARWNDWTAAHSAELKDNIEKEARAMGFREGAFNGFAELLDREYVVCDYSQEMISDMPLLSDWLENSEGKAMILSRMNIKSGDKDGVYKAINSAHGASIVDRGYYANKMVAGINDDFNYILFFSSIIVFFALLISYGRLELALLAFLPMCIGWVIILGLMAIFGVQFNIVSIILATFIFGIGDDFSIFIMDGLMAKYKDGSSLLSSHKSAIFFSAFTMLVGIGVLVIAKHPAMKSIGMISVLGIIVVLLVEFTVQPFLFRILVTNPTGRKRMYPADLVCILNSIYIWTALIIGFLFSDLLAGLLVITPLPKRWKKAFFHWWCFVFSSGFLRSVGAIRFKTIGYNRNNYRKPSVIIANHESLVDILIMLAMSPKTVLVTKKTVFSNPLLGPIVRYADFINAEGASEAIDNEIEHHIADGYSIVVFPEATRSVDHEILRFHKGAFLISEKYHLDIRPVVFYGTGYICPKHQDIQCRPTLSIVKCYDEVPWDSKEFGDSYQAKARNWRQWYIREFEALRAEYHHPSSNWYIRRALLSNYTFKGPELWRAVSGEVRRSKCYDKLERQIPRKADVVVFNSGWGASTILLGMLSKNRNVLGVEPDGEKVKVAQNCYMAWNNIRFEQSDPRKREWQNADVFVVPEALASDETFMAQCRAHLNDGGKILTDSNI